MAHCQAKICHVAVSRDEMGSEGVALAVLLPLCASTSGHLLGMARKEIDEKLDSIIAFSDRSLPDSGLPVTLLRN
jgi:hypothetical protein